MFADPGTYNTAKYGTFDATPEIVKHSFFKSKVKREFIHPHQGPSPGDYEPVNPMFQSQPVITSSFKAVGDRFKYALKVKKA